MMRYAVATRTTLTIDDDVLHLHTANQVTDTYLLALAVRHGGRLATLDRKLTTLAVPGGAAALALID